MKYSFLLALITLALVSCQQEKVPNSFHLTGSVQGTSFNIRYHGDGAKDFSEEVGQILSDFDQSLSLWQQDSFLSQANASEDSVIQIVNTEEYFIPVFNASVDVYHKTQGAFDPSVYPLVRAWGFGAIPPDSDTIPNVDSLLVAHHIGGFKSNIGQIGPNRALMKPVGMELDFNGIAQGYSVDVLAEFLESKGLSNYLVEIGGELRVNGKKQDGTVWRVGIEKPENGAREVDSEVLLHDESIATSGSYRKFKERNGKRYSHCIDPRTGYPVTHTLLSVTVIANTCATADAYATAFMVMGVEATIDALEKGLKNKLEVLLVYDQQGENRVIGTGRFKKEGD